MPRSLRSFMYFRVMRYAVSWDAHRTEWSIDNVVSTNTIIPVPKNAEWTEVFRILKREKLLPRNASIDHYQFVDSTMGEGIDIATVADRPLFGLAVEDENLGED